VIEPLPLVSTFSYLPGEFRYEVKTESAIRQPGDSTAGEAHVRTASFVRLRLDTLGEDSLAVEVVLDSAHAERDSLVPAPDSLTTGTLLFSTYIDSQGMSLASMQSSGRECSSGDSGELLAVARDLLIEVPRELLVGATWSDTSTVTMCRGGVPVTSGVVRSYEVLDPRHSNDGTLFTRIARTTAFSLAGTRTTAYGQVIALSGSGESRAVLELDVSAGIVRGVTREGTSAVTVTYGRTSTPFTQVVRQSVRLVENEGRR
jgi:hypothetical protein